MGDFVDVFEDVFDFFSGGTQEDIGDAQNEVLEQNAASEELSRRESIRQSVREDRIRRAQLLSSAESSGVSTSSGLQGTVGALSTNLSANLAFTEGQDLTSSNVTALNQEITDLQVKQQKTEAFVNLVGSFL